MSIEAKPDSNPYEAPKNTELLPTPSPEDLHDQIHPGRKRSILEKLDTHGKRFTAAIVLGSVVLGGGYGASKIAEGIGQQQGDKEPGVVGPATPGQSETATPQTTAEATPDVSPSAIPVFPSPETSVTGGPEKNSPASEFNISEAEYNNLVDSFKIDVATHPTAESALAAFNEKMTLYFNGGNTAEERTKHYTWSPPAGSSVGPGWNSRATELYSTAIQDALFVPGYENTANSYVASMKETKSNASGLWANSLKNNETPYVLKYEFTPAAGIAKLSNGNFTAYGSVTFTDNADAIPSAKTDSRATFTETIPNQTVTAIVEGDQWLIHSLEAK